MAMMPRVCPLCGGEVDRAVEPVEWDVRRETVVVENVEHGVCGTCGEEFFDPATADAVHLKATERLKAPF